MLIEVYDDDAPAVLWLFCGRTNADDDHERWLASMLRMDKVAIARATAVALLIIDDDNPPPPTGQRERITEVARAIRGSTPLAVVTSSSLARTIIAGLNLSGVVRFPLKGFADVNGAVAWLAARTKQTKQTTTTTLTGTLHMLVDEARAKASMQR